jgi:hypothetical protein
LYMLNMILHMPEKYPLDMVVNFDLEIDWIWTKQVVDYMESRCKHAGIKFVRIKPRRSWNELYEKYDVPTRRCRWCNSDYKLDCKKQLNKWIEEQNCRPVAYIGFCADEEKRFTKSRRLLSTSRRRNYRRCYPSVGENRSTFQRLVQSVWQAGLHDMS